MDRSFVTESISFNSPSGLSGAGCREISLLPFAHFELPHWADPDRSIGTTNETAESDCGRWRNATVAPSPDSRFIRVPSPCLRSMHLLEETGVIERYGALLDSSKVGIRLAVFARGLLTDQHEETVSPFVKESQDLPQVVDCQREGRRLRFSVARRCRGL